MTELIDLLKSRRSVPPVALETPGPDGAQLETLLRVAARVPDHGTRRRKGWSRNARGSLWRRSW